MELKNVTFLVIGELYLAINTKSFYKNLRNLKRKGLFMKSHRNLY